ncbi:MAG: hypothetical protein KDC46_14255 [Thermoleophilia bacterium]|nr:hypothetical protein [Thermoleophilia bacterium]
MPLLRTGTRSGPTHSVTGVRDGIPFRLGPYQHTFMDGADVETRSYNVVVFTLPTQVAARFAGVHVRPRHMTQARGAVGRRLDGESIVSFESEKLDRMYSVSIDPAQDQLSLYELLDPSLIVELENGFEQARGDTRRRLHHQVGWEQQASALVCFCGCPSMGIDQLDELLTISTAIARNYLDEST